MLSKEAIRHKYSECELPSVQAPSGKWCTSQAKCCPDFTGLFRDYENIAAVISRIVDGDVVIRHSERARQSRAAQFQALSRKMPVKEVAHGRLEDREARTLPAEYSKCSA